MVKTIGIIGAGTVGNATARVWMEHAEVRIYDVVEEKTTHPIFEVIASNIIFVCLPELSLDTLFWSLDQQYQNNGWRERNYVIKSTVPIGTTRFLKEKYKLQNIVHSPEFLTERCAVADVFTPSRNIVGDPTLTRGKERVIAEGFTETWHNATYMPVVSKIFDAYQSRFPGTPLLYMSSDESEAVKLATNAFFATKITFFNELHRLCKNLNMDWETVLQGILSDGRIAHSHTQVPGPDGKFGFGGKCLPKDLQQYRDDLLKYTGRDWLAASVIEANKDYRGE